MDELFSIFADVPKDKLLAFLVWLDSDEDDGDLLFDWVATNRPEVMAEYTAGEEQLYGLTKGDY